MTYEYYHFFNDVSIAANTRSAKSGATGEVAKVVPKSEGTSDVIMPAICNMRLVLLVLDWPWVISAKYYGAEPKGSNMSLMKWEVTVLQLCKTYTQCM